jgi:hypothetical protein
MLAASSGTENGDWVSIERDITADRTGLSLVKTHHPLLALPSSDSGQHWRTGQRAWYGDIQLIPAP